MAFDSAAVEASCRPVAASYVRNGTWLVPTLVVVDLLQSHSTIHLENTQMLLRMLHQQDVKRILAGSDCAADVLQSWGLDPVCHRGLSVLQELVLLAGAGLTPLEALQSATLNPAIFFGATDSLGTVAPGKLADLVLLDANPLADIRNVMKIRAVVANGRYFDGATLDTFDAESPALAKRYNEAINGYGQIRRGVIGVAMEDAPVLNTTGEDGGSVLVTNVFPNSGAMAAGITVGDTVFAVDGQRVRSLVELRKYTRDWQPGHTVRRHHPQERRTRHVGGSSR